MICSSGPANMPDRQKKDLSATKGLYHKKLVLLLDAERSSGAGIRTPDTWIMIPLL